MLVECIPNFSEGKNTETIRKITEVITSVDGVKLLGVEVGESANRTVVTFIGDPKSVCESAFLALKIASQHIDMQEHRGTHPRMGATDVCPLVPVLGISIEETNIFAHQLAKRVGEELDFPVYCYEFSSTRKHLRRLEQIRSGEYESLKNRIKDVDFQPDYGSWTHYKTAGATVIGVRDFLVAYNFNINTTSQKIAQEMARDIRESGRIMKKNQKVVRDENNQVIRIHGSCQGVKAIGWKLDGYPVAQVSTNITNVRLSPVHFVYEALKKSAEKYQVKVTGAELIGLVPLKVMLDAADFYLEKMNLDQQISEREKVQTAIHYLGLNDLSDFDPDEKIIEYKMKSNDKYIL